MVGIVVGIHYKFKTQAMLLMRKPWTPGLQLTQRSSMQRWHKSTPHTAQLLLTCAREADMKAPKRCLSAPAACRRCAALHMHAKQWCCCAWCCAHQHDVHEQHCIAGRNAVLLDVYVPSAIGGIACQQRAIHCGIQQVCCCYCCVLASCCKLRGVCYQLLCYGRLLTSHRRHVDCDYCSVGFLLDVSNLLLQSCPGFCLSSCCFKGARSAGNPGLNKQAE